jgi:hypothetical protein
VYVWCVCGGGVVCVLLLFVRICSKVCVYVAAALPLHPPTPTLYPSLRHHTLQILNTEALNSDYSTMGTTIGEVILASNGFAEVYPEHKFQSTVLPYTCTRAHAHANARACSHLNMQTHMSSSIAPADV